VRHADVISRGVFSIFSRIYCFFPSFPNEERERGTSSVHSPLPPPLPPNEHAQRPGTGITLKGKKEEEKKEERKKKRERNQARTWRARARARRWNAVSDEKPAEFKSQVPRWIAEYLEISRDSSPFPRRHEGRRNPRIRPMTCRAFGDPVAPSCRKGEGIERGETAASLAGKMKEDGRKAEDAGRRRGRSLCFGN